MNAANFTRDKFLATTIAACALASTTLATPAIAQAPPSSANQAPTQSISQTISSTTIQSVADDLTPDAGLAPESIAIGDESDVRIETSRVIEMLIESRLLPPGPSFVAAPRFVGFDAYGRPRFVQPQVADLEPVCIRTVSEGSPSDGPIYAVTIRNVGDCEAGRFRVSLVAGLCGVDEFSPTACTDVPRLGVGESVRIDVQLPLASLAMRSATTLSPFDTLIAAIDTLDQIPEPDERNNLLALKRESILPLEAAIVTETVETSAPGGVASAPSAGAAPDAIPPSMTPGDAGPGEIETPAPPNIDGDALDGLDLPLENAEMRALFR